MSKLRRIVFTEEEQSAYFFLGVIVAISGYKEGLYERKIKLNGETEDESKELDLLDWFAWNITTEELNELHAFRNRIVHGVCIVHKDGTLTVYDNGDPFHFTLQELEMWAKKFLYIKMENRVNVNVSVKTIERE